MRKKTTPQYAVTPEDYVAVFSSEAGARVLSHFLLANHFFEECDTMEENARRNACTRLLRDMGAFRPETFLDIAQSLVYSSQVGNARRAKLDKED